MILPVTHLEVCDRTPIFLQCSTPKGIFQGSVKSLPE